LENCLNTDFLPDFRALSDRHIGDAERGSAPFAARPVAIGGLWRFVLQCINELASSPVETGV